MISDVLSEAVGQIRTYLLDPLYREIYSPEDLSAIEEVVTFMDALRCSLDLCPGEFTDRWRPLILEKIRKAGAVSEELCALQGALYDEAARGRALARLEDPPIGRPS
jgi:hypothetical protein